MKGPPPHTAQSTGGREGSGWARNFVKRLEEAARRTSERTQPALSHTHTRLPGVRPGQVTSLYFVLSAWARGPCFHRRTHRHTARSPLSVCRSLSLSLSLSHTYTHLTTHKASEGSFFFIFFLYLPVVLAWGKKLALLTAL